MSIKKIMFLGVTASLVIFISIKVLPLYLTKPSLSSYSNLVKGDEMRGIPPYKWIIGKDKLPHMEIFFWVPKDAHEFVPYADKGIKTYVTGHGSVESWGVFQTGKMSKNEKLMCFYVPKTFVIINGKNFYKLLHLYYN